MYIHGNNETDKTINVSKIANTSTRLKTVHFKAAVTIKLIGNRTGSQPTGQRAGSGRNGWVFFSIQRQQGSHRPQTPPPVLSPGKLL